MEKQILWPFQHCFIKCSNNNFHFGLRAPAGQVQQMEHKANQLHIILFIRQTGMSSWEKMKPTFPKYLSRSSTYRWTTSSVSSSLSWSSIAQQKYRLAYLGKHRQNHGSEQLGPQCSAPLLQVIHMTVNSYLVSKINIFCYSYSVPENRSDDLIVRRTKSTRGKVGHLQHWNRQ